MDVPILRTMTRKSLIGFGRYADLTVDEVLTLKNTRYLRWVYYTFEGLTFSDDVLDILFIGEEWSIEKPGKSPDTHIKLNKWIDENINPKDHFPKRYERTKAEIKKEFNRKCVKAIRYYSKRNIQWRNQGH